MALPNGLEQPIQSTLEGMDVAKGENLALDSEGGAEVKTSAVAWDGEKLTFYSHGRAGHPVLAF